MFDLIIIGGGPGGLCAGIYATRGGLKTAIVENMSVGGQASTAHDIQNYPGIKSTSGFDLCYTMLEQCKDFGAEFIFDNIISCDLEGDVKHITLASGATLDCKRIIIATGASSRPLGVDDEGSFVGKGLSYCATCDGNFFRNKVVAVVGGGNTAAEDALYLEKIASKVYIIHRRNELRADKILQRRIENSNIEVIWDSVVTSLIGNEKLTELTLNNVKTNTLTSLLVDGVFVAIGQTPNTKLFENIDKDESGYILTDDNMHTNIDGVFAIGDCRSKSLRQVVTACSDGAIAADQAIKDLM